MTLQVFVPMRYIHERYFGRPACPKCGELMMASLRSDFSHSKAACSLDGSGFSSRLSAHPQLNTMT